MSDAEAEGEMPERGREVWIEKYRPESLDGVLGHDHITERLESYIERNDLPHLLFAGPAGTGKCVTGETPVLTNRGVARIEDVVGDVEGFATPDDGTEVLTLGQDGEFQYVEPSHVFGKRTDDLVSVRTRDGAAMTVTPEHKLLVFGHDGLEWKRAVDLSPGERVARPLSVPLSAGDGTLNWVTAMDGDHTFVHVTEEFAAEYGIPAEENHVGTEKLADTDLDEPSTVCSLSYLRSLDVHRDELKQHVEGIQYVTRYNQRSRPITPPWSVTPALATFVGLAVSEARIDNGKIEFFNTDGQLLERFEEAATELFDVKPERGKQKDVPYSVIRTESLTHYLESCFDVFAGATGRDGIGSALVGADRESRSAFLRAVFDGEAYVQRDGTIELTRNDGELITLLSYLLAGFGISSRRKTQRKAATNGSGRKREYHVLSLSGAHNLSRFQDCVGFSLEHEAERVAANAARTHNPNDDTIPVQDAVDAATAVPAGWVGARDALGPIETRHEVADLYYDEVESVERLTDERRVYDLTVPVTRNYVAGHVPTVMHNTTCAVAIAKELYGEDWRENFLELNASDERGIDVVRERIKNFARASFGGHDHRIIFLDEADALCVPPGTEVVTGYPSSPEVKKIEDVAEDGEPIPSVDFETNEIQSDKGRLVDSGVADFFEVELADGRAITASLTHPFFVVGEDGTLVEKELRELSPGDEIADFEDDIGVSRCGTCGDWTAGDEFEPALVSDGGLRTVETTEIRRIEYSHREKAYNISMEGTPNFMLANGILTHNTSDAQAALRRTMEQFSNNTRFILSCNFSSRIIDPIQSRCAVFRFSPLDDEAVKEQIRRIAEQEDIEITDDGVDALVYAADGDMRKAINGLQAAAVMGETVDEDTVFTITSTVRPEEIRELVTHALEGDFSQARSKLDDLLTETGVAGGDVIDQIHRSVWEFDLDDDAAVRLMERVGEADYRITAGANEQVQLEALLASLALDEE